MSNQQTATPVLEGNCCEEKSESCKIPKKSKDKFTDILTQTDARVAGSTPTLSESEKDKVVKQLQEIGIESESDNLPGNGTAAGTCPKTGGGGGGCNGAKQQQQQQQQKCSGSCQQQANTCSNTCTNCNSTPVKDCSKQTEKCKDCNCYKSRK